jgi:hypothetical protein
MDSKKRNFSRTKSGAPAVHENVQRTNFSHLKDFSYHITGHPEKETWAQASGGRANLRACGEFKDEVIRCVCLNVILEY